MLWRTRRRSNWVAVAYWVGITALLVYLVASGLTLSTSAVPLAGKLLYWALVFLAFYLVFSLEFLLRYRIEPDRVLVRGLLGWFAFRLHDIARVEKASYKVRLRVAGISGPTLAFGRFNTDTHGLVRIYGRGGSGEGVILGLRDGAKVILTPEKQDDFIQLLREYNYPVVG
ncbi:PH domain-containing protein [Calidithermus chliarophilus]|uniref:PH domain-containing protein n=1 Tax=Calidithermus chliarophilus TaxID=52023 RepID=UPI0004843066|nr:PH domain-containing protein [Calidithermus chliarophilus]